MRIRIVTPCFWPEYFRSNEVVGLRKRGGKKKVDIAALENQKEGDLAQAGFFMHVQDENVGP